MRKLILRSRFSFGDIVLLTAAVRDLHRALPGEFQIDVRTCFPHLWENNPGLTPLNDYDPEAEHIDCGCSLVQRSEQAARHCLNGFHEDLGERLGVPVPLTEFRGDIRLSAAERAARSPLAELTGEDVPYWLINAGGKDDFTVKWWEHRRYQEVVDQLRGRVLFVQVGDSARHHHPPLQGVIDLRGQTTVRDLVRLMHRAQGVLCGVTGLMHLAAAVPVPAGNFPNRPCVVVAGGREPPHWEAYPGHQFIHTVGALPCCATRGCWRSRVEPLGDGDVKDQPEHICADVRDGLPRCMDLITPADVLRRIEGYLGGGAACRLTAEEAKAASRAMAEREKQPRPPEPLTIFNAAQAAEEFIATIPPYPGGFEGRGIVICAGGVRTFTNAWVCIRMLRRLGSTLPIELWHWGELEIDAAMRALVEPHGVVCVDASARRGAAARRLFNSWALKPLAIAESRFQEALLLDADNVPVANPEYLFDVAPYREAGAVLWPDYLRLAPDRSAWKVFGVPYCDEPEVESGQVLMDKARCWRALQLCLWYNEHAEFFYRHVHGDKETFHLAFRRLDVPYAMPATPIHTLPGTMCQHDFEGRRVFQHRNTAKWRLFGHNPAVPDFLFEDECRGFLRELGALWNGRVHRPGIVSTTERVPAEVFSAPEVRLSACMISCRERDAIREETVARLRQTDWGARPLHVQMDSGRTPDKVENISHNGWCALREGLKTDAEYILFLEDDLDFNRHLFYNLQHWPRLRAREITLGTLYNPRFAEVGWDMPPTAFALDARFFIGNQALLISRSSAEFFLDHWFEAPPKLDVKLAFLASRLKWPIFCHNPSLVQHEGRESTWGGKFHRATDFDPVWKAPLPA